MQHLLGFLLKSLARGLGLSLLIVGAASLGLAVIIGFASRMAILFRMVRWVVLTLLDYAMSLTYEIYTYGQRLSWSQGAAEVLEVDLRPHVLLLRSFSDDHSAVANSDPTLAYEWVFGGKRIRSFEEALAAKLAAYGPVIAIGRPGEKVAPLGAARLWVPDHSWQARVEELLHGCRLVVMIVGEIKGEDGLAWEVGRLLSMEEPEKVVLVVPPIDEWVVKRRWQVYHRMSGGRIPPYMGGEVAARFTAGGGCRVVRFGCRADGDYLVALGDLVGPAQRPSMPRRRRTKRLANGFREVFRLLMATEE
jgi:hypothetical protein